MKYRFMHQSETKKIQHLIQFSGMEAPDRLPVDDGLNCTIVATEDGYLVGTVSIRDGSKICYLAVSPNHRGRGIGRQLMKVAYKQCRTLESLHVKMWNIKALRLYWSEGFRINGRRKLSFSMKRKELYEDQLESVEEENKSTLLA
jgi:ribosomal protein S18 acetylase RimI-like enzyme